MPTNARVEVRQFGDPALALKSALHKLRKAVAPELRRAREMEEGFVSESRKRRAKMVKAKFLRDSAR